MQGVELAEGAGVAGGASSQAPAAPAQVTPVPGQPRASPARLHSSTRSRPLHRRAQSCTSPWQTAALSCSGLSSCWRCNGQFALVLRPQRLGAALPAAGKSCSTSEVPNLSGLFFLPARGTSRNASVLSTSAACTEGTASSTGNSWSPCPMPRAPSTAEQSRPRPQLWLQTPEPQPACARGLHAHGSTFIP